MHAGRLRWRLMAGLFLALLARPVLAATPAGERPRALLISLVALVDPLFSLRYEQALTPQVAVAVTGGYASYTTRDFEELDVGECGLQALYVVAGAWSGGLVAGLDARRAWNSGTLNLPHIQTLVTTSGTRDRLGGLIGLRWTGRTGLTVEVQWLAGIRHSVGETLGTLDPGGYDVLALETRADLALGLAF